MPQRPPRLKVQEDGSIALPLSATRDEEGNRVARDPIILPEPNMVELAAIADIVQASDKKMVELTKELPEVSGALQTKLAARATDPDVEFTDAETQLITERAEVLRDRNRIMASTKAPHAEGLLEVVALLTGQTLTIADLPGWAGNAQVLGEVQARFMDPFAGRAADLVAEAMGQPGAGSGP